MRSYPLGTQLVLATTFLDAMTMQPADPTTVVLEIKDPIGNVTTPATTHPGVGLFKALFAPTLAGIWTCRWVGTGAVIAATEHKFEIRASAFAS